MRIVKFEITHSMTSVRENRYNHIYYSLSSIIRKANSECTINLNVYTPLEKGWIPSLNLPCKLYSCKLI